MSTPVLVWFRRNLRLTDNPPLAAAVATGQPIVPVYILDETAGFRTPGDGTRWWLHHSLDRLNEDLASRGVSLVLRRGPAEDIIPALARECGANEIYFDTAFDPAVAERDACLAKALGERNISGHGLNATLLFEPGKILTREGNRYQIFGAFWRTVLATELMGPPLEAPGEFPPSPKSPHGVRLNDLGLLNTYPDRMPGLEERWNPGEAGAQQTFRTFLSFNLTRYAASSEMPGAASTSRLSPHLAFGEIGPLQIWHAVRHRMEVDSAFNQETALAFLREMAWREFNYQLLQGHPDMARRNIDSTFDKFPWRTDDRALAAWKEGQTGYPLVDAGMRELRYTGWLPNRVRMVVASFLTKHLLVDWRHGEAWFWDMLVDADPANNPANWQWVAGSGIDAAPYYRIFNPIRQGETFDHDGVYVRRWVPEVSGLSAQYLHKPWAAPLKARSAAGLVLGGTYPAPLVDHAAARVRALDAYNTTRG